MIGPKDIAYTEIDSIEVNRYSNNSRKRIQSVSSVVLQAPIPRSSNLQYGKNLHQAPSPRISRVSPLHPDYSDKERQLMILLHPSYSCLEAQSEVGSLIEGIQFNSSVTPHDNVATNATYLERCCLLARKILEDERIKNIKRLLEKLNDTDNLFALLESDEYTTYFSVIHAIIFFGTFIDHKKDTRYNGIAWTLWNCIVNPS